MTGAMAPLQVEPVRTRADRRAWLRLPRRLYADNPHWVPVPELVTSHVLNTKANPLFHRAALQLLLARRDGQVVGRIAAVDDPRHNEIHGDNLAFFGFVEAEDEEAFVALMRAAEEWAGGRGRTALRGPFNPAMLDSCGFLVDGYDDLPRVFMPYNPPEYLDHVAKAGYQPVQDVWAWQIHLESRRTRMTPLRERLERKMGADMEVVPLRVRALRKELGALREIFNEAWKDNWGFVPLDAKEFDFLIDNAGPVIFQEGSSLVKIKGEVVAGAVAVWDVNRIFHAIRGKLFPLGWVRLLSPRRQGAGIRTALLGVKPEFRRRGLDALLIDQLMRGSWEVNVLNDTECSWVLADNTNMNKSMAAAGCVHYKTYRIFERSF